MHELHLHTNYSFQDGASTIGELVGRAAVLGYQSLAITDHDNLIGSVEFAKACRDTGIQPIIGCEVTLTSGYHLTLLSESRHGYSNLCWLVSQAYQQSRRNPSLEPVLLDEHAEGLIALSGCRRGEVPSLVQEGRFSEAMAVAKQYRNLFGAENYFVELQQHYDKGDQCRMQRLVDLALRCEIGVVVTGNVHYHVRERHRLQDCLVAMKHKQSLNTSHQERRPNSEFALMTSQDLIERFSQYPEAIQNTVRIAKRCESFDLTQHLGYEFPLYDAPKGYTSQGWLEELCHEAAQRRYGEITPLIRQRLRREFDLIDRHNLAGFLLIYRDIIKLAHEVAVDLGLRGPEMPVEINPPGRGRGSSVSMLVGYLFGISHIDPLDCNLSLERFLPDDDLASVPDIDLDFPRNIREELILRIHRKYGWDKAALTGMVVTYRLRGCIRELGKVLGLPSEHIDKLAKYTDERDGLSLRTVMLDLPDFCGKVNDPLWRHLIELAGQLYGFPRQLAQHPGGMVVASTSLTEIVPVQPSAIDGRYLMQWDKDSIELARFVKIDFLAIGALSQMQDAVEVIRERHGKVIDLSRIDFGDPKVYRMLHEADTVGVFQVESAAQQQTITRIRPTDLVGMAHEVAAVRPGVGVNNGVRAYIARRRGRESVEYDHPLVKPALERTLGVILFQDQVNHVARLVAGLSHSDADRLRRAFTKRSNDALVEHWWDRFRRGASGNGLDESIAWQIFQSFNGQYMFPESHAFAFGITAYQLAWLKYYYPLEFFLSLFNHQPMGFYAPETLKEDAKRHGVTLLNPDVNLSSAQCQVEGDAIRLGLLYVQHVGDVSASAVISSRKNAPYQNLADFVFRSRLRQQCIEDLIDAGALDTLCRNRRQARWEVGLRYQPLLGRQKAMEMSVESGMACLPRADAFDEMLLEYQKIGMHPTGHVMAYLRERLGVKVVVSKDLVRMPEGRQVRVAGLVIRRQRPSAKAVFVTLEDEFGHIPMVIWPNTYTRIRNKLKASFLIAVGVISRREDTMNIVVQDIWPMRGIPNAPQSRDFK